jgi:hypothetical protein
MVQYKTILYLDDERTPFDSRIDVVRNFDGFVAYITTKGVPDLISFDHDLSSEHYTQSADDMRIDAEIDYMPASRRTPVSTVPNS